LIREGNDAFAQSEPGSPRLRNAPPRIIGELRKLGIEVAKSTVEKYRVRRPKPPSPTW
jgi:hypothetical protein